MAVPGDMLIQRDEHAMLPFVHASDRVPQQMPELVSILYLPFASCSPFLTLAMCSSLSETSSVGRDRAGLDATDDKGVV